MNNPKLILTVGIPGTGKSTWAKNFVLENDNYLRVSRDDYRRMLFNVQMGEYEQENLITKIVNSTVRTSLTSGVNVIIDQTNVKRKYIEALIQEFNDIADIEFKTFGFDVNLQELHERNQNRLITERVPKEVIDNMYNSLKFLKNNYEFESISKGTYSEVKNNFKHVRNAKNNCYIFDIDGTLAERGDRGPFDWDRVGEDTLKADVFKVLDLLFEWGIFMFIFSGRDSICRKETEEWLRKHDIEYDDLYMRAEGDNRKDSIIKQELFEQHIEGKYNCLGVFDDRDQVVKMWRDIGVTCFQVDYGNF